MLLLAAVVKKWCSLYSKYVVIFHFFWSGEKLQIYQTVYYLIIVKIIDIMFVEYEETIKYPNAQMFFSSKFR